MTGWVQRHEASAELHFAYSPDAIAALKDGIPHTARHWHPAGKFWRIDEPFVDTALSVVCPHVGRLRVADLRRPRAVSSAPAPVDWAQALFAALPEHLREPAYKALLRILHPDVGGDGRMAQRLNDTFRRRERAS
jgi:hypothetical protein